MQRWGLAVAGLVVFVLVASQILIPGLAERRVESRLTEGGGTAEATLGAVPAFRLLLGDGERFEVTASGLELELDRDADVFRRLDGFGIVEIAIEDSRAGPIRLESFELARDGAGAYTLESSGSASAAELVELGIESLEIPGGPFAGLALETLFGESGPDVPVELDLELTSDDGRVEVVGGDATVAGAPAGPLAELVTSAVLSRL